MRLGPQETAAGPEVNVPPRLSQSDQWNHSNIYGIGHCRFLLQTHRNDWPP